MLETAMWPVSPSSNSTTTESRSSSSLEAPAMGRAQLTRRQEDHGVLSRVLLQPYYTSRLINQHHSPWLPGIISTGISHTQALTSLHTYSGAETSLFISSQKCPIDSCLSAHSSVDLYVVFSP